MFLFVTSRSFKLVEKQRDDLARDLTLLQTKYDNLLNQFIWRATKIPLDPDRLPADYRESVVPKKGLADPGAVLNDVKKEISAALSPRAKLREVEAQRNRDYLEEQGKMHVVPDQEIKEA